MSGDRRALETGPVHQKHSHSRVTELHRQYKPGNPSAYNDDIEYLLLHFCIS